MLQGSRGSARQCRDEVVVGAVWSRTDSRRSPEEEILGHVSIVELAASASYQSLGLGPKLSELGSRLRSWGADKEK